MQRNLFEMLSPLDHRYAMSAPQLYERLSEYLSEAATIAYQAKVEAALAQTLAARGLCPPEVAEEIASACAAVSVAEVYREEERTRHNIRALVNAIQARVSDRAKPYVHFTATSFDIIDTARALQLREATLKLLLPQLKELVGRLIALAQREAETVQAGRTHGQHAVPITFGFAIATFVSRLGERTLMVERCARNLRGKFAGAVGAYNASSLFFNDPEGFEREVLGQLDLEPSDVSTQIVSPEYVLDYVHALTSTFGVLADIADDMRHLQRTEIGEVGEAFGAHQVGSSTMPHKRNPWNFEHVKSLWKAFMPRMQTLYLDQLSEHQRDLTNSASMRFVVEIVAALALATQRLSDVVGRLVVDRARMQANFQSTAEAVVAEPLYILLAAHGHPDAHEAVRRLTLAAQEGEESLLSLAQASTELRPYLDRFSEEQRALLARPQLYTGRAAEKTRAICSRWAERLGLDPVADGTPTR